MSAGETCHAPRLPWRMVSLVGIAAFWIGMACSRWGEPFFFRCLAGTIICGIPWLVVWRAEVWPQPIGGKRSQYVVNTLLWLSMVPVPVSVLLLPLLDRITGLDGWTMIGLAGISFVIGFCCCITALLIQFFLNRWTGLLSASAVLLQLFLLHAS